MLLSWMGKWIWVLMPAREIVMVSIILWRSCCKLIERCKCSLVSLKVNCSFSAHRRFLIKALSHKLMVLLWHIKRRCLIHVLNWVIICCIFYNRLSAFLIINILVEEIVCSKKFFFSWLWFRIFVFVTALTRPVVITIVWSLVNTF